jgi:hypothetical protein
MKLPDRQHAGFLAAAVDGGIRPMAKHDRRPFPRDSQAEALDCDAETAVARSATPLANIGR